MLNLLKWVCSRKRLSDVSGNRTGGMVKGHQQSWTHSVADGKSNLAIKWKTTGRKHNNLAAQKQRSSRWMTAPFKAQNAKGSHTLIGATLTLVAPRWKVCKNVHLKNWSYTTNGDEPANISWSKLLSETRLAGVCYFFFQFCFFFGVIFFLFFKYLTGLSNL